MPCLWWLLLCISQTVLKREKTPLRFHKHFGGAWCAPFLFIDKAYRAYKILISARDECLQNLPCNKRWAYTNRAFPFLIIRIVLCACVILRRVVSEKHRHPEIISTFRCTRFAEPFRQPEEITDTEKNFFISCTFRNEWFLLRRKIWCAKTVFVF